MGLGMEREVVVLVKFRPRATGKELIQNEILQLLPFVRRQSGCLHFDLYRSANASDWFLHQVWMSGEAYERYQHSQEAGQLRAILQRRTSTSPKEFQLNRLSP
jgi:quinol monooxygenase YgiN